MLSPTPWRKGATLKPALCGKMHQPSPWVVVTAASILASLACPTHADTLAEAVTAAYRTNPTLQSQRAQLRAIDEEYASALSALGPTVQVQFVASDQRNWLGKSARATQRLTTAQLPDYLEQNAGQGEIIVSQPLYTGGRASAQIDSAAAKVRAGREGLKATEANLMLSVVQAYADLLRDTQSLSIRRLNLETLQHQVVETKARWKAGEVTQTDVSQAEAQLAAEQALYAQAQGLLANDRAAYVTIVGQNPGDLAPLPDLDIGMKTVDQAFEIAENESPDLKQAYFTEAQSRANVSATKSAYNGSLSASFQYGYSGSVSPFDPRNLQNTALGQVTYTRPLYTSGLDRAQVRQALDLNQSDRFAIETARRNVIQSLANGWNQMVTANRAIAAQEAQVKAAAIAFKGMRLEYRAGDRSTLDVLVAEETLRDAELQLVSAKRDAALAKASILRQLGRLSLSVLAPTTSAQDPSIHFAQVIHDAPRWTHLVERADRLGKRRISVRFPAKLRHAASGPSGPENVGLDELVKTLPIALPSSALHDPK